MRPMRMLSQMSVLLLPETRQCVKGKEETLGQVSAAHSHGHRHAEKLESQRPPSTHQAKVKNSETGDGRQWVSKQASPASDKQFLRGRDTHKKPGLQDWRAVLLPAQGSQANTAKEEGSGQTPTQLPEAPPWTNTFLVYKRATSMAPFIPKCKDLTQQWTGKVGGRGQGNRPWTATGSKT